MAWTKHGRIHVPSGEYSWSRTHAQTATADRPRNGVLRIYYGTRDALNRTVTTYIDVAAEDPRRMVHVHDAPVLGLGELGCFDDSGAMPCWIVNHKGAKYLYYNGWNTSTSVPYRIAIGLAVLAEDGKRFSRLFKGPVMDRSKTEPQFCGTPCILIESGTWRMWYVSCVGWEVADGRAEPLYHIKYAESQNGIEWDRKGRVCIPLRADEGGIARPCVVSDDHRYLMWYSYRKKFKYREDKSCSYRIGYAESSDGLSWKRLDEAVGIDVSNRGWDSEMVAYPCVYEYQNRKFMLYNGNGFGRSGIGCAVSL